MNKSEKKFRNNSVKMINALLKLLERKDFTDITILELCNEAGVNRSTFYSHYDNTYDLLKDARESIVKRFTDAYVPPVKFDNFDELNAKDTVFITPEYLIPWLEFIKNNRAVFKIFMNNLNTFSNDEFNVMLMENVLVPVYRINGITDKTVVDYMSKYYICGVMAIVMEWVNRDCADDIEFICEIITMCVRPYAAAKNSLTRD